MHFCVTSQALFGEAGAELLELYPGRFVGFGGIDGSDVEHALAEIERCAKLGFKGVDFDNG